MSGTYLESLKEGKKNVRYLPYRFGGHVHGQGHSMDKISSIVVIIIVIIIVKILVIIT